MTEISASAPLVQKSTFITVLASSLIFFSVLGILSTALQMYLLYFVMPFDEMYRALMVNQRAYPIPPMFAFLFQNIRFLVVGGFVFCVASLVASICLLKRMQWARVFVIALLALSILWNLSGLIWQRAFPTLMPPMPQSPPGFNVDALMTGIQIIAVIFSLAFAVLFGWIIKKLLSPAIKAEFRCEDRL